MAKRQWVIPTAAGFLGGVLLCLLVAAVWFSQKTYTLALLGDPVAQFAYGKELEQAGKFHEGMVWVERSADAAYPPALLWLSVVYSTPDHARIGTYTTSQKIALEYALQAAQRGFVPAMLQVGLIYELKTKLYDPDQALFWHTMAAVEGNTLAISRLIEVYGKGELGQKKSEEGANVWRRNLQRTQRR